MLVGVLALQGDFATHEAALQRLGVEVIEVRTPEDAGFATPKASREKSLKTAADFPTFNPPVHGGIKGGGVDSVISGRPSPDALVLPGGESSTFDLLGRRGGLDLLISAFAASGRTLFGTCAGAIWLGKGNHHRVQPLGLIDVTLVRNAYGRQVDSFIAPIQIRGLDEPFEAVFIRAPKIVESGCDVEVLAEWNGDPVFVRKGNIWLTTFHPERTEDPRIHQLVFGI